MNLTDNERRVIEAYKNDDFVGDVGWEDPEARTWVKDFHKVFGMDGAVLSGVMSSLSKKGIIKSNGESFSLTKKGIAVVRNLKRYEVYIGCEEWQDFNTVDTMQDVNEFFSRWRKREFAMGVYSADEAFYEDLETNEKTDVYREEE